MRLSLVIPAYNEAGRIGGTIGEVCAYLDRQRYDWELLVVIDGGAGADEARSAVGTRANVRVIQNDVNRGKGYSVRRGFLEASGDRRAFIDADLSLPIEGLEGMMACFDAGADVVIASRTAPGSRVEGAPPAGRAVMSRLFNIAVQVLAVPGIKDTQCGFKGFTARAAQTIFSAARSDRFGFDVEALYLARKHRFRIAELPVTVRYRADSSVNRISDGVRMLGDVIALRLRHRR